MMTSPSMTRRYHARMTDPRRALVLFSGGQDSTACLAWALDRYAHVETIGFDYGQRHVVELECRLAVRAQMHVQFPRWASKLGDDHLLDLSLLGQISDTALTDARRIEMKANGLPNTFVPGRNLLFFTFAATIAYRRGLSVLVGGMCETDFSGYPDCRDNTLKALQVALNLGMDTQLILETPLMWLDKAQTWALSAQLGGEALNELIVEHTHTCYLGDRTHRHDWGYGCGLCPACALRARGYKAWRTRGAGPFTDTEPAAIE
jgi:7-cyano-7-deazaguanine synthase